MDYSYSFQDNIPSSTFNTTCANTANWIEENRDKFDWAKDPNAYEMVNLFLFGAKYSHEGKDIDKASLAKMWEMRSQDFERCNISSSNFVYAICQDSYEASQSGKSVVNDENSHHALRKIAGLGLYLKQQQRNGEKPAYNNPQELLQLLECSRSLKTFHPDLYDKYAFEENLDVLCKLQLQNNLSNEVVKHIQDSHDELSKDLSDNNLDTNKENIEDIKEQR